ncbi:PIN domain-containing protein [Algoriphagus sp. C2-6-M1]|uniref:PIN domain-containing protein n=1 Tax=Algoriphagus persicinus TaxID=3108754 RepID=UPI002B3AD782|nr:PIN domain-containing protein [Algoriphagus sp. C2-6-M1]MEB2780141.1 PIN domain-containing protein [Algoriphagus sp. C2-6-M1]
MIFIDTNALILLVVGLIDKSLISTHKRTSIFESIDFENLTFLIGSLERILTTPNVLTEVDNLLNNFQKGHRWTYYQVLKELISKSTERFIESKSNLESQAFFDLGLTDSGVLEICKECDFLITGDSKLADYANAYGIKVVDLKKIRNDRLN